MCHNSWKYAQNAPDTHRLHWRAKRRQARAYMDTQCSYLGRAALMHYTLPTNSWDGSSAAMLRTLTAYYENASPQCEPPTNVNCYQALQVWCRAVRRKTADMPDKGIVMMPPLTEFLFQDWATHYEADPALKGEYAAAGTGVAEHRRTDRQIDYCGQLLEHHYVIVHKAVTSNVIQGVHSYSQAEVEKTLGLLHRRSKFHGYTPTQLRELMKYVVRRCYACQNCKPQCGSHPKMCHYFPIPKCPFASLATDIVHLPACVVRGVTTCTVASSLLTGQLALL